MNRIDRMLGYVLALQTQRRQTAAQLAGRFEVSKRTVYRDLEALCEIGVPLVSQPGLGYTLAPSYHLPPVMLTSDEASSLALAGGLFRHFVAHGGRDALDAALQKVAAVLPETTRDEVAETQRRVCLISWPHQAVPLDGDLPQTIQKAIRQRRRLSIRYHARTGSGCADRTVEPHALVFYAGDWHLLAYCLSRAAVRQFRLSRVERAELLDQRFDMPDDADARSFWANNNPGRTGDCVARVRFAPEVLRWVRERRHYAWESEEETSDGLVVTFRVDRWEELLPWLLGWGSGFEVLDPAELRLRIADEARAMFGAHQRR